jgi:hypothetical protein
MFLRDEEKKSMRRRRPPEWTHEYILGKNPAKPSVGPFDEVATQNAPEVLKRRRGRPPKGLHKLNPASANMQSSDTFEAGCKGDACLTKRRRGRPLKLCHGLMSTRKAFEHQAADPEVEGKKETKQPLGGPPKSPVLSLQPHGITSEVPVHERLPKGLQTPNSTTGTSNIHSSYTSESGNKGETSPIKRPPKQHHCSESSGEAATDPDVKDIKVSKRPRGRPRKLPVLSIYSHGVASEVHGRPSEGLHQTNSTTGTSSIHSSFTSETGNEGEASPIKRRRGRPPKQHFLGSPGRAFETPTTDSEMESKEKIKQRRGRPPKSLFLSVKPNEANGGDKVKKRRRRKKAVKATGSEVTGSEVDPLLMRHGQRPPKRLLLAKREAFPESMRLRHGVKKSQYRSAVNFDTLYFYSYRIYHFISEVFFGVFNFRFVFQNYRSSDMTL